MVQSCNSLSTIGTVKWINPEVKWSNPEGKNNFRF